MKSQTKKKIEAYKQDLPKAWFGGNEVIDLEESRTIVVGGEEIVQTLSWIVHVGPGGKLQMETVTWSDEYYEYVHHLESTVYNDDGTVKSTKIHDKSYNDDGTMNW